MEISRDDRELKQNQIKFFLLLLLLLLPFSTYFGMDFGGFASRFYGTRC